jgi:formylglycine-generating enzyme required for sulfatase activity
MVSQKRGAACFWIDETEVTVGEYGEFAAKTAPYQSGTCQGKPDFNPDASCLSSLGFVPAPGQPVVCVDWCDADAYCTYAGKRLCGGEYAKPGDAANSEWFSACSGNGAQNYPYGKTYVGGTCQDSCQATCETVVAGADTACVSPCGAYDLSGNVAEWVNECNGDISCNVRGGAKTDGQANVTCEAAQQVDKRSVTNAKFRGFRCCGDPS